MASILSTEEYPTRQTQASDALINLISNVTRNSGIKVLSISTFTVTEKHAAVSLHLSPPLPSHSRSTPLPPNTNFFLLPTPVSGSLHLALTEPSDNPEPRGPSIRGPPPGLLRDGEDEDGRDPAAHSTTAAVSAPLLSKLGPRSGWGAPSEPGLSLGESVLFLLRLLWPPPNVSISVGSGTCL